MSHSNHNGAIAPRDRHSLSSLTSKKLWEKFSHYVRPKRWVHISWFGGIQVCSKEES
ncbi:MAG: hypothetical protein HC833_23415 [Leptolyngbyaceae cyanobacterium RM1_406_9]|nr:hypothetical protein [Leptolyngbyaceae cyanobacterium RM1_406_9]